MIGSDQKLTVYGQNISCLSPCKSFYRASKSKEAIHPGLASVKYCTSDVGPGNDIIFNLIESRHPLIRNMITVQIWLDYQPFTCIISLNYHSFIGYKWNTSQIQLKYKGAADSLLKEIFMTGKYRDIQGQKNFQL